MTGTPGSWLTRLALHQRPQCQARSVPGQFLALFPSSGWSPYQEMPCSGPVPCPEGHSQLSLLEGWDGAYSPQVTMGMRDGTQTSMRSRSYLVLWAAETDCPPLSSRSAAQVSEDAHLESVDPSV
jgi:hypothetical protein